MDAASERKEAAVALTIMKASLEDLKAALAPTLGRLLDETLEPFDLLQKAKMNVLLSYITHNLVWVYLRATGTDPRTHAVMVELDCVKQYFSKIMIVKTKESQHTRLDQAAASCFIKHAITSSQVVADEESRQEAATASAADEKASSIVVGTSSRFIPVAEPGPLRERASDDEDELVVIGGDRLPAPHAPSRRSIANGVRLHRRPYRRR